MLFLMFYVLINEFTSQIQTSRYIWMSDKKKWLRLEFILNTIPLKDNTHIFVN